MSEDNKGDAPVAAKEVELQNVEAAAVAAEDKDDGNQLSTRAISKRAALRKEGKLAVTQVKGQYTPNPDYQVCCCGVSQPDFFIIVSLFIIAYAIVIAFFVALLELTQAIGSAILWIFFGAFMIALAMIGFAVYTGAREKDNNARIAAMEAKESMNV